MELAFDRGLATPEDWFDYHNSDASPAAKERFMKRKTRDKKTNNQQTAYSMTTELSWQQSKMQ